MKKREIVFCAITLSAIFFMALVLCVSAVRGHEKSSTNQAVATEISPATITATGLLIRQEQVLQSEGAYVDVLVSEGEKLAVGGVVARQYGTAEAMTADDGIQYRAASEAEAVTAAVAEGRYSAAADFAEKTEELWQRETTAPEERAVDTGRDITVGESGWFSFVTDGAEQLSPEAARTMTKEELLRQMERTPKTTEGVFGKLVTDGRWIFSAVLPAETVALFAEGDVVRVSLADRPDTEMTVLFIGSEEDGECVIGFEGKSEVEKVLGIRTAQAVIQVPKQEITETEK